MSRRAIQILLQLILATGASTISALGGADQKLPSAIDQHIQQPRFANASWGIQIVSLQDGRTLYETNSLKLHKPASNAKLFTGALALDRLGPEFRFKTELLARGKISNGTLRGDLMVRGGGDPTFSARFNNSTNRSVLAPIVDAVKASGLRRVSGDLIADESLFRGPAPGGSWTWDDLQHYYGAVASALTVNDNTLDFTVTPVAKPGLACLLVPSQDSSGLRLLNLTATGERGSKANIDVERPLGADYVFVRGSLPIGSKAVNSDVTVPDPAMWFGTLLKHELANHGIKVSGKVRTMNWRDRELGSGSVEPAAEGTHVLSRPLREILPHMMKPSQNLYAQLLLLQVGAMGGSSDNSKHTTEELGLAELYKFLDSAGIEGREVLFDDGSGLSRASLVTPHAIVGLLRYMDRHPAAQEFKDALPIAGVDGTLAGRMKGTAAAGNVRAKTGTIRYVNSLSGYVTAAGGECLAFSILLNNYSPPDGAPSARSDLDHIAVMLAELGGLRSSEKRR